MREEGIIKGWGLGVNRPEPILKLLDVADPDVCLLASQYSLIDHKNALQQVFPAARAKGVSFVVGSSLNAGFISGSRRYNYGKENYKIPQPIIEKREIRTFKLPGAPPKPGIRVNGSNCVSGSKASADEGEWAGPRTESCRPWS